MAGRREAERQRAKDEAYAKRRGGENQVALVHNKIKEENSQREHTVPLPRLCTALKFVILIIEHFKLHLDLICIKIHNHVDWLRAAMDFGEHSNPVWEY